MTQRRIARQAETQDRGDDPSGRTPPEAPALQPNVQDHIGRQLRAIYDDVLSQPVPDRFRELMERLDRVQGDGEDK
ncbi:NepR family anti-sigma factor [Alsobacter sp. R-9]